MVFVALWVTLVLLPDGPHGLVPGRGPDAMAVLRPKASLPSWLTADDAAKKAATAKLDEAQGGCQA